MECLMSSARGKAGDGCCREMALKASSQSTGIYIKG